MASDEIVINPDTGEYLGVVVADGEGRRKRITTRLSTPYVVAFLPGLLRAATDPVLVGTDYRVLLYVASQAPLGVLDWDASPSMIADALRIDRQRVSRSLRRLTNRRYLNRPGRGKVAFAPGFAWRGNSKERELMFLLDSDGEPVTEPVEGD